MWSNLTSLISTVFVPMMFSRKQYQCTQECSTNTHKNMCTITCVVIFTSPGQAVTTIHTLKAHSLLHWPAEIMKWGRMSNMSTNVCEILHKTALKKCGKNTNQREGMCKQVLHRAVERSTISDACAASDKYHGLLNIQNNQWKGVYSSRYNYI
jgi:hypothetical protein